MLKQLVELESKFNKACNAMERSEEELITTTNLLAATQVVVDGTGDSPNTAFGVVTLEEIKQMKSKETLLQQ